jgi:alpha-ketoglutarate-dependent taurine dioxygenase
MQHVTKNAEADTTPGRGIEQGAATAGIQLGNDGLSVRLQTGEAYFNYYWLRDNCTTSIDPQTRERVFDISGLDSAPRARSAYVDGDVLVIEWSGENHISRYALAFLVDFQARGAMRDDTIMPRRLWRADHYGNFSRISQNAVLTEEKERWRFARALLEDGIALVTGMVDSDESLTWLANALGDVVPSTSDSYFFDVRLAIDPNNLAFTAKQLEMHTDLPSEQLAPGIQFLHCRANSVEGGSSLFVDGAAVAEDFRKTHPAEFELLCEYRIPFFRRSDRFDVRAHQTVIELDREGSVSGLTISQHLADVFDLPQSVLDHYYPAFCQFLRLVRSNRYMNRFRLNAGECIVFDNHRIVHGREAFNASRGKRHLRGCYVDRGALRSTYRILTKRLGL